MEKGVTIKLFPRPACVAAAALLCLSSNLYAATPASGPILANTVWSQAQSPYEVTGDVFIQNGATLTVEPGVQVYFKAGTSLIVETGALKARGTATAPIVFTSAKDKSGGTPAPGDWGQVRFLPGTHDATTLMEHVQIKYGQGISIQSASPTLNYLTVANNLGPAISLDLQSSPTGVGNKATGNTVNGVVVPPGDIATSVAWKLKGIPYVVPQGIVSVGQSPILSGVSPTQIQQGEILDVTFTGTRLAGVESVTIGNPGVSATLLSGATATTIPMRLTASAEAALGPVTVEAQVTAGKVRLENAFSVIPPKPPIVVSSLNPSSIRRGETKTFQATGENLNGATVTTAAAGLSISNVQTTATQVTFAVTASSSAGLGAQTLTFTNAAVATGSATAQVTILNELPKVYTSPAPLAVPPDSIQRQFKIRLSAPDYVTHDFTVAAADPTVANVSPTSFSIPAGQTEATIGITGLKNGQTSLTISSSTLGTIMVPVYVTAEFGGVNIGYAPLVGVVVEQPPAEKTPTTITPLSAAQVGVVYGSYIQGTTPSALTVGTGPVSLVINGAGLAGATSVAITPSDGLTLGTLSVNPDGNSLSVPVTIAADAPTTMRQINVFAGSTRYLPANPRADRINVVLPTPVVESVDPLSALPGSTALTLTVRGRNFKDMQSVAIAPADGLTLGTPVANADGTQFTLSLTIATSATVGPRVVVVTTLGGVSAGTSSAGNTFNIVNQLKEVVTPIAAPNVGVVVEETPQPTQQTYNLVTKAVGVAVGAVVTEVSPANGTIGETLTLTLRGSDLGNVSAVTFAPDTGLTVSSPAVAADGKSLAVNVVIAADAPQVLRTIKVSAGSAPIPFAAPVLALFRVTAPQPQIDSVTPLFLQVGQPLAPLTVRGKNFQNVQQVQILPPDKMTVSTPSAVNADGTELTVNVAADATAMLGTRVIVVATLAGETTSTALIANTITLTSTAGSTYSPILAPQVGVMVQEPSPPVSTPYGPFVAPAVGIVVEQAPTQTSTSYFVPSAQVGVALGPVGFSISPTGIVGGNSTTLVVQGQNLNSVTGVSFSPADGVTVGSPLQISPDGTQVSVPITVAVVTAPTGREVVLTTAGGNVGFANPGANRLSIAVGPPAILSISPILATRGNVVMLTVTGTNLQNASAVTATPPDGITFVPGMTVNSSGTQVTVQMAIDAAAPTGPRVIQVVTPGGATPATPAAANTFTVHAQ